MAEEWLDTLPAPNVKNIKVHQQQAKKTIKFDDGSLRSVNRASNAPYIIECQFFLNAAQKDAFDYFLQFNLNFGVNWIDAPWLTNLGFGNHYCRFLKLPVINQKGKNFNISIVGEIQIKVAIIQSLTLVHGVSNIPALDFPPNQVNLRNWYKADDDGKFVGEFYDVSEKLVNHSTGSNVELFVHNQKIFKDVVFGFDALKINELFSYGSLYGNYLKSDSLFNYSDGFSVTWVVSHHSIQSTFFVGQIGRYDGGSPKGVSIASKRNQNLLFFYDGSSSPSYFYDGVRDVFSLIHVPNKKSKLYRNGVLFSESLNIVDVFNYHLSLQCLQGSWGSYQAHLHEILIYQSEISLEEIDVIHSNLMTKWQIE